MMMDYNLLNRASFNDTKLTFAITAEAGKQKFHTHKLPPGGIFCARQFDWKYAVGSDQSDWPKVPMQISINDVITGRTESPLSFSPPALLRDEIRIGIQNSSMVAVIIHINAHGTIVAPIAGTPGLSDKEILGYSLLDDSQRGMLALSEAAVDRLDDNLRQVGLEGYRDRILGLPGQLAGQLPGQQLPGQLPGPQPQLIPIEASPTPAELLKELPLKSADELMSLLLGDLVTYKSSKESDISLEEIQNLASYLLEKGWFR